VKGVEIDFYILMCSIEDLGPHEEADKKAFDNTKLYFAKHIESKGERHFFKDRSQKFGRNGQKI